MAPIQRLRAVGRAVWDDVGDKIKGAGEDVKEASEQAADQAKDTADTVNQAKNLLDTYNQLKDKVTGYYQWYLDHKPLIYFIIGCIVLIVLMCLLQCAFQYLKCCFNTCNLGWWCIRKLPSCCSKCGECCIDTRECITGREASSEPGHEYFKAGSVIDTTYIMTCGNPTSLSKDPVEAQKQKLGPWVKRNVPCVHVPQRWAETDPAVLKEKAEKRIEAMLEAARRIDDPDIREKLWSRAKAIQRAGKKASNKGRTGSRKRQSAEASVVEDGK